MFIHLIITEQVAEGQKPVTLLLEQFLAYFTLELDNFLATLNVPTMNSQLFKMRERKIGNSIEKVAKDSAGSR